MELYRTFMNHIRIWTPEEIMMFALLMIVVAVVLGINMKRRRILKSQAAALFISIVYMGLVFASTVIKRAPLETREYQIVPFWSWYKVFTECNLSLLKENILNCILLMPLGTLFPFISDNEILVRYALLTGILIAAVIECCQLIFMCGLFEWDDMIHNGLGCMSGCFLGNCVWKKTRLNFSRC